MTNLLRNLIALIRPKQMPKNLLIIVPIVISGEIKSLATNYPQLLQLLYILMSFFFASSIVYIFNDLMDRETDSRNPKRSHRPIASGEVKPKVAIFLMLVLGATLTLISLRISATIFQLVFLYLSINLLYSIKLKEIQYWELMAVSSGYILRVLAGTVLVSQRPSLEFFTFILFFALAVVTSKRLSEVQVMNTFCRKVLSYYTSESLKVVFTLCISLSSLAYTSFVIKLTTMKNTPFGFDAIAVFSLVVLLVIFFRFVTLTMDGMVHSPEELLIEDRFLQINVFCFSLLMCLVGILR